jgi:hypothetical protein
MARAIFVITLLGDAALLVAAAESPRAERAELIDMMQGSSIQATRGSDTPRLSR